ncbi:hypothetical protein [Clostridium sp.]|jgi:hypothetical protein|uniref:hypothetical protein n=1 Tax=Clostridium sp. TaxID=1506 RepID=UPI00258700A2|nr:hypothetical protein [Clostridium sp.]
MISEFTVVIIIRGMMHSKLVLNKKRTIIFDIMDTIIIGNNFPVINSRAFTEESIRTSNVFFSFSSKMK